MTNSKATMLRITLLFLVMELAICIALLVKGNTNFIPNVAGLAALWIAYTLAELRYGFYMNNYVRAVAMIVSLSDNFCGYYLNYYLTSFVFDKIQHAFGTYAFSLFAYILIAKLLPRPVSRLFTFILIFTLGIAIGAIYEIGEFVGDQISKPDLPSQPSLLDTDLDLIGDMIGAAIAGLHGAFHFSELKITGNSR